jgi:glutamate-1-semialdehyde 2,1-aminomutase
MNWTLALTIAFLLLSVPLFIVGYRRIQLSLAKHPSLRGHSRMSRLLARLVPFYEYDDSMVYRCDGASESAVARRKVGFATLRDRLADKSAADLELGRELEPAVSDMQFTNAYRVPFQFRNFVRKNLRLGSFASATEGVRIRDLDGNWSYDLSGSYGVNLLGYDFYKDCIRRGAGRVEKLGPVLGPYHPIVAENVRMISEISGLDEVSFHMSGTEAVMQAVRLARYHTRRSQTVLFCGAYHGWWDGVQPGVGNQRSSRDVYTLKEMSDDTLRVLDSRKDIACVLVNPLQALHPNAGASSDAMLVGSERSAAYDREAYSAWLVKLRDVCSRRGIVLIFDEVFVGFRLGVGGAQEYFGVNADMVTYGKTLGGGLPVGVLCGTKALMKRYRSDRPTDVCFARGTFNTHPYVMASMNEFLHYATSEQFRREIAIAEAMWDERARSLNERLAGDDLPVRVHNLSSIWTLTYAKTGRFNWMLQYYLRAEGLALSWVGTGRLIFSHNYTDEDFAEVAKRIIRAVATMQADGWWEAPPALTDKAIKREVLREILSVRLPALRRLRGRRHAADHAARESSDRAVRPS